MRNSQLGLHKSQTSQALKEGKSINGCRCCVKAHACKYINMCHVSCC